MIKSYLKYYLKSRVISSVKHPFVNGLNDSVFSKLKTVDDIAIQTYVESLKTNKSVLSITDLGAGSKKTKANVRRISSIVKNAAVSQQFGRLLAVLVQEYNCETIIELGTSLGVGTSYLAAKSSTTVYTIEGCPNISEFAQNELKQFSNINFFAGEFSSQLNAVLKLSGPPDLVYIDGNHTYKATIDYFNFFLKHAHAKTILVFDDIHWSSGMEKAWSEIIEAEEVSVSMDLFRMGIVFLDKSLTKNQFTLRF